MKNDDFTSRCLRIKTFDPFWSMSKPGPSFDQVQQGIWIWSRSGAKGSLTFRSLWLGGRGFLSMIMWNLIHGKHAKLRVLCWFINVSCCFFLKMGSWNENRRSQTPGQKTRWWAIWNPEITAEYGVITWYMSIYMYIYNIYRDYHIPLWK
jgi:hypothetical protein